jgi:CBS domain-containing protein
LKEEDDVKIRELLKIVDRPVITIGPEETVAVAVQKLIQYDRGSISVCNEKGDLLGIVTERDIARKCFVHNAPQANIKIKDVMTKEVAIGSPEDDLDDVIGVMKQKRIRHVPILEGRQVVGIVSIRDILTLQLSEKLTEIHYAGLLSRRHQRPIV